MATFLLHILHLGHDFPGMSTWVEVICVETGLQFGTLLPTMSGEDVFVVFEIVVVELVKMFL